MNKYEPTLENFAEVAYRKMEKERLFSDALKSLEDMIVATSPLAENDANVRKAREGAIKTLKEAGMSLLNCKVREGTIILPEPDMYDEGC